MRCHVSDYIMLYSQFTLRREITHVGLIESHKPWKAERVLRLVAEEVREIGSTREIPGAVVAWRWRAPVEGIWAASRGGERPPLTAATTKLNFANNLNAPGSGRSPEPRGESGAGQRLDRGLVRPWAEKPLEPAGTCKHRAVRSSTGLCYTARENEYKCFILVYMS